MMKFPSSPLFNLPVAGTLVRDLGQGGQGGYSKVSFSSRSRWACPSSSSSSSSSCNTWIIALLPPVLLRPGHPGLHMLFFSVCCHQSLSLFLSLSLSHTHTHTHTHSEGLLALLLSNVTTVRVFREGESFQHINIQVVRETELTCCLSCH